MPNRCRICINISIYPLAMGGERQIDSGAIVRGTVHLFLGLMPRGDKPIPVANRDFLKKTTTG